MYSVTRLANQCTISFLFTGIEQRWAARGGGGVDYHEVEVTIKKMGIIS